MSLIFTYNIIIMQKKIMYMSFNLTNFYIILIFFLVPVRLHYMKISLRLSVGMYKQGKYVYRHR